MLWWILAVLLVATVVDLVDEGAPCPDLPNSQVGETARLDAPNGTHGRSIDTSFRGQPIE